ncbi:transport and Golgi organization protein 1 isoform X2 [Neodiprion fabricii]|uniref:transport and Golgi organization protein 1 isoform X2 n=1 Tax=Neodiprion fabricii TaxID=2872261 RepID=UPI001ED8C19D|nr:transport and Golgi organization protein 1 isoform X2 [Neodiprion fabricii]
MTKIYLLTNIVIVSAIIAIFAITRCDGVISDKRLCYDEKCNEPVSLARTLLRYNGIEPLMLSFPPNVEVRIYSKEAGSRLDLWGAEVHGKRGYLPKHMVREQKILKTNLTYEVPTELFQQEVSATDQTKVDVLQQEVGTDSQSQGHVPQQEVTTTDETKVDVSQQQVSINDQFEGNVQQQEVGSNDQFQGNVAQQEIIPTDETKLDVPQQELSTNEQFQESVSQQEVDTNHDTEINVPSQPEIQKDSEKVDFQTNGPADELQVSKNVENVEIEANGAVNKLETSNDAEDVKFLESHEEYTPTADFSQALGVKAHQENSEQVLQDIQSATPSYEVIDGTRIPFIADPVLIKPSYVADQGPILSVHPNPSIGHPLTSSLPDSQETVEEHSGVNENLATENQIGESGSMNEFIPTQGNADNAANQLNVNKESKAGDGSEIKFPTDEIFSDNNDTPKNTGTMENRVDNSEMNGNEGKLLHSDTAAGSFVNDPQGSNPGAEEDIPDNIVNNNFTPNAVPSLETDEGLHLKTIHHSDVIAPEVNLESSGSYQREAGFHNSTSDIAVDTTVLDGNFSEQDSQDSKAQTEYLLDRSINFNNHEMDGLGNVGKTNFAGNPEISPSNQIEKQDDNQVPFYAMSDVENSTSHNASDDEVKTVIEDDSQNNLQEVVTESADQVDDRNFGHLEVVTEPYSNLEEEKSTTTRNLLILEDNSQHANDQSTIGGLDMNKPDTFASQTPQENEHEIYHETDLLIESTEEGIWAQFSKILLFAGQSSNAVASPEVCDINSNCPDLDNDESFSNSEQAAEDEDVGSVYDQHNYLETLMYLGLTAFTTLLFSLGYYYIENQRRDKELVAKINTFEKELLVITKENMILGEDLKTTKNKLNSIEDESFGSNEMVLSLKSELEMAQVTKGELEDQIITLEKELESATEAGLELERMLREFLASQSDDNPLAQSVEDLQTRLNAQQATNESLTNSLNLKSQENEVLTAELAVTQEKYQQLEVEVTQLTGELKVQRNLKKNLEEDLTNKIMQLNERVDKLSEERATLINQLTLKEVALNDLAEVMKQSNDKLDFKKLYDISHIKADAQVITKERDELKIKLTEVEGAHQLLEDMRIFIFTEHTKLIKEEIASVTEQYELAERDKIEAQTRLEVLSNYFKEKESQLQKELGMQEAMWVQKQGEVTSTVDRIQTMQNEIQNYRQQIETLKREILDQEREYKSQISALETKSHEQWVIARQSERRLEESKAEASQLRNRLTLVEKSINEVDADSKLHRMETNGETASSPQLFLGAETSNSPVLFTGSSGIPPPIPPFPPYPPYPVIPGPPHSGGGPMYDISRRPPPLGGRLSSPPPIPLPHPPGRYEDASSPPPPLSPPLHPSYNHRSPPPFSNEHAHMYHHGPPPPFLPPLGTLHSWGDDILPPTRNPVFHPHQREQRVRNHKGSLHSSGDSLDKSNHTGKA